MKSTTFIAILLTFLMLLLVTGAAAFFLWQGQQDLQTELQLQQAELNSRVQTVNELQTTAAAREMDRATSEATIAGLEAQIVQAGAQLATSQAELATAQAATPEAVETPTAQPGPVSGPPQLQILYPKQFASVTSDVGLLVIVIASTDQGISSVAVQLGERQPQVKTYDGATFAIYEHSFPNIEAGTLEITAVMTSTTGTTEDTSLRVTVQP